jgi:hypothetical protein
MLLFENKTKHTSFIIANSQSQAGEVERSAKKRQQFMDDSSMLKEIFKHSPRCLKTLTVSKSSLRP